MDMLKNIKFTRLSQNLGVLFYLLVGLSFSSITQAAERSQLVILHFTDLHGHLRPDPADNLGGYARLTSLIKKERSKGKSHQDILVIGGGDFVNKGALPCRRSQEEECIQLLPKMQIDLAVFGNHELTKTAPQLNSFIRKSGMKWFSSNVKATGKEQLWTDSSIWKAPKTNAEFFLVSWAMAPGPKEWDSKKAQLKIEPTWSDLHWKQWQTAASGRPVILVPHQEYKSDIKFLEKACQTFSSPRPLVLLKGNDDVERAELQHCLPLIEPMAYGKSVAKIILEQNPDKSWRYVSHEFLQVDSSLEEDPQVAQAISSLYSRLAQDADEKVLELTEEMNGQGIAQWLAKTYQKVSKADLAIVNTGSTKKSFSKGAISREQLFMSIPFNNSLKGFDVSKKTLEKAMCQAATRTKTDDDWGSELILSQGELKDVGTPRCRLEGLAKSQLKVVMDDFLMKNSKRWIGQDFSSISFNFGLNTEQALNLALGVKPHK